MKYTDNVNGTMSLQHMFPMSSLKKRLHHVFRATKQSKVVTLTAAVFVLTMLLSVYLPSPGATSYWTKPCKYHKLDPWDVSLREYLLPAPSVVCSNMSNIVYTNGSGFLVLNETAVVEYAITTLACTYQIVKRRGDFDAIFDEPVKFTPPVFVQGRVFRMTCLGGSAKPVYDFIHYNIFWNESSTREREIQAETDDTFSIVYLGLDSASRSHVLRKLPRTYKYLTDTLRAFDFQGYMKVGANSFPNIVPLLTGTDSGKYPLQTMFKTSLDNLPYIWREKAMSSYATLYAEDRPDISTFHFLRGGFSSAPVDYYFRPVSLAMDRVSPVITKPLGKMTWHCYGNRNHFSDTQIGYLKEFMIKYKSRLNFAYLWNNQIGHEDFLTLGRADEPMLRLLEWMNAGGHLTRTVLIVGSDHGFRLGGASTTYVGRLENNMPFLAVYLPPRLRDRYPWMAANLRQNTERLISPYDVYQTMTDVVHRRFVISQQDSVSPFLVRRSLLTEIPESRTCVDAGIPAQYCTCNGSNQMNTSDHLVLEIAKFVVKNVNRKLFESTSPCQELFLQDIVEANVVYSAEGDADNSPIRRGGWFLTRMLHGDDRSGRYTIVFRTLPNRGQFEAMVDYTQAATDQMALLGEPLRIDRYGNQSHCVDNGALKQYCFCSDVAL